MAFAGEHRRMAALVAATQFLVALDGSLMIIALPSMGRDLQLSLGQLAWVQNTYALGLGAFLVVAGRLADLWTPRRAFVAGASLFAVAALAAATAPNGAWLMAARGVAGVAAAMVFPSGLAVLAAQATGAAHRARAIGAWGTATAVSAPVGAVTGGALVEALGWRALVLLGACTFVVVPLARPVPPRARGCVRIGLGAWGNAMFLPVGIGLLLMSMGVPAGDGGGALAGAAVAMLAMCLAVQACSTNPLLPRGLLCDRQLVWSIVVASLGGGSILAMAFFLQQYLQTVQGMAPGAAGLAYAPAGIAFAAVASPVAMVTARHGPRRVVACGFALGAVALAWLSRCDATSSYWPDVLGPLLLTGISLGMVFVGISIAGVGPVVTARRGVAGGLVNSAWQLGGAIGLASTVAIVTFASTSDVAVRAAAIRHAFEFEAGIAVAGLLVTVCVLRGSEPPSETNGGGRVGDRDGNGELRRPDQVYDVPAR
jgi:MFS family permease